MKKRGLRIELHPIGVAHKAEKRDLMVISINPETPFLFPLMLFI